MGIIDTMDTCCVHAMAEAESIKVADILETTQTSPSTSSGGSSGQSYSASSGQSYSIITYLLLYCSCCVVLFWQN